ncbi:hypothetical protein PR048_012614 [Dryococelus australis]|uniref:Uncharacterized protein n=1 Tax=Dryococelus australis TaxID=614101 RepID=A0ABQ9HRA7_9NEOP|nr:hypothetical protein PR048_012614 [Dryococelus australis]
MMSTSPENIETKNSIGEVSSLSVDPFGLRMAMIMLQLVQWLQFECFMAKPQQDVYVFIDTTNNVADMVGWQEAEKVMGATIVADVANPEVKTNENWSEFVFSKNHFKVTENKVTSVNRIFNCLESMPHDSDLSVMKQYHRARPKRRVVERNDAQYLKGIRGNIQRFVLSRAPHTFEQAIQFAEREQQNELLANKRGIAVVIIKSSTGTRDNCGREGCGQASQVLGLAGAHEADSWCKFEEDKAPVKYKETSIQCGLMGSGAPVILSCREVYVQCSILGDTGPEKSYCTDNVMHSIDTGDARPISVWPYKIPDPQESETDVIGTNDAMPEAGVIV